MGLKLTGLVSPSENHVGFFGCLGLFPNENFVIFVGQDKEIEKRLLLKRDSFNSLEKALFTEAKGTVCQNT